MGYDDSVTDGEFSVDKPHTQMILDSKHTGSYGWKEDLFHNSDAEGHNMSLL